MQYYRLWIYSCNVVLALTSTIFIIFAAFVVADFRLTLLEGVELYHPTFFYAYGALILQCGVVQTIGCLGAQRLSHKLLSLYWTLLLLLTLGDIGVGLYWVFHLEKVKLNLRPYLSKEFIAKYSTDESFTLTWNKIQSQDRCCGVNGPFDFERFAGSHDSKQAAFSANSLTVDVETNLLLLPESCCTFLYAPATVSSSSGSGASLDKTHRFSHYPSEEERPPYSDQSPEPPFSANDDYHNQQHWDFAGGGERGGGRRSRTIINLPHKNDDPRMRFVTNEQADVIQLSVDENEDDEEEDNDDGEWERRAEEYYDDSSRGSNNDKIFNKFPNHLNYFHQSPGPVAVVPDDNHNDHQDRDTETPESNPSDSLLQKRDIKTHEPNHAHKVRHELHRKSQPSSLIDVKSSRNATSTVFIGKHDNVTNGIFEANSGSSEESASASNNSSSQRNASTNETRYRIKKPAGLVQNGEEIGVVPKNVEIFHSRQNRINKTNKLFPSISFRVRRERRETRALLLSSLPASSSSSSSVTQVPAVNSAPPIQRHLVCHGQPEGLNHRNSHKKDLRDQRETTTEKAAQVKTSSPTAKKLGAAWIYRKTTRTPSATASPATFASRAPLKPTSAEITYKMKANEIEKLAKRDQNSVVADKSLLARGKAPLQVTTASTTAASPALHSSKLTSSLLSSRRKKKSTTTKTATAAENVGETPGKYGMGPAPRQKRAAQMKGSSPSDPHGHLKGSRFAIRKEKGTGGINVDPRSFSESYFYPSLSSAAAAAASYSSTSYLDANSPQATIMSSSTPYEQWNENNIYRERSSGKDDDSSFPGNTSYGNGTGLVQKKLYVYGVGCGKKLIDWVDHVSGIMFILGFCIICFAKTCFLVILRTEIREMIEKIHMIEPEEVMSPSRTHSAKDTPRFHHVSHPLLQNPHRASTVSAHGVFLPTIKSPDGPSPTCMAPIGMGGGYTRPNRHYLRRASNIVGGDRSRSHSNETVNMSLLMTASHSQTVGQEKGRSNPNLPTSAGGSTGTIANIEEKDPVSGLSITVPNSSSSGVGTSSSALGAARYLRRSSTCSSSTNPVGYYGYGFEGLEPRAGPSSRFYQYFEPLYQTSHMYQQHHHHHYTRNRSHARNMSCGAILPLASYRSNSAAAAASAALSYRGARNLSSATATTTTTSNMPNSTGLSSFSSTSKDETEMIISVSLEHIASSDQDEEAVVVEEEEIDTTASDEDDAKEQEKKEWAAATSCIDDSDKLKSASKVEDSGDTKLQTFSHSESANESGGSTSSGTAAAGGGEGGGGSDIDFQRRNGNNNVDLTNSLPMSYIGTAV